MMIAEITNAEYKKEILPGLSKPFKCCAPRKRSTEPMSVAYDVEDNTLTVKAGQGQFFMNESDAQAFFDMVLAELKRIGHRVHAEISYEGVYIADGIKDYWNEQVSELETNWYLSVQRVDCTKAFEPSHHAPEGHALIHRANRQTGSATKPDLRSTSAGSDKVALPPVALPPVTTSNPSEEASGIKAAWTPLEQIQ